jgi:hypothetical protein
MVTINGERKYRDSIKFDSSFLREDIIAFLEARSWEKGQCKPAVHAQPNYSVASHNGMAGTVQSHTQVQLSPNAAQMSFLDDCPF